MAVAVSSQYAELAKYAQAIADGRRVVGASEAQFEAGVKDFFDPTPGFTIVITPAKEMEEIARLLPSFSTSAPYAIKTKTEFKDCPSCGREGTFLDVVTTALKTGVHTPEFLADVFAGKYGKVINFDHAQRALCYGCNTELPAGATKFSAPVPPTKEQAGLVQSNAYQYSWKF